MLLNISLPHVATVVVASVVAASVVHATVAPAAIVVAAIVVAAIVAIVATNAVSSTTIQAQMTHTLDVHASIAIEACVPSGSSHCDTESKNDSGELHDDCKSRKIVAFSQT